MYNNQDMKLYIIKKEKGHIYESRDICKNALGFELRYDGRKPIGCSISDTKNFWACAVGLCGLDIEEKNRRPKPSLARAFHRLEQTYLAALEPESSEHTRELLRIWTAKEALFKLNAKGFKDISALEEDLGYKKSFEGFNIFYFEDRALTGCLITQDDFYELEVLQYAGSLAESCMDCAARLLAVRAYPAFGLSKKLREKGYPEDEVRSSIARLTELGYIDDALYASRYAEDAKKGYGCIKQKLRLEGIAPELIPKPDPEREFEKAMSLALLMEGKSREQIARRLSYRGFAAKTVYDVLARLREQGYNDLLT